MPKPSLSEKLLAEVSFIAGEMDREARMNADILATARMNFERLSEASCRASVSSGEATQEKADERHRWNMVGFDQSIERERMRFRS